MRLLIIALSVVLAACGTDTAETTATAPGSAETAAPEPTTTTLSTATSPTVVEATTTTGVPGSVTFPSDDLTLHGRVFGEGTDGVVLAHMRPTDQTSWWPFAEQVAAAGYTVLTFDFRGYGDSEGGGFAAGDDVAAAIAYLRSVGVERVIVVGGSMGGTGAVAAGGDATAVVTLSAPTAFMGTDALAAAPALAGPLWAIAAEEETPYPAEAEALAEAAPDGSFEILSGRAHGTYLFDDHPDLPGRILEFIVETFGG